MDGKVIDENSRNAVTFIGTRSAGKSKRFWAGKSTAVTLLSSTVIRVTFNVPTAPLVWDATQIAPGIHANSHTERKNGKGFEVLLNGVPATISSVAINEPTSVDITVMSSVSSGTVLVQYAMTEDFDPQNDSGTIEGSAYGRRGQLRDSDSFKSFDEVSQPNFCVAFSWTLGRGPANVTGN
jgi:hypothetical protein